MDVAKARGEPWHFLDAHRRRGGPQAVERVIAIVEQISTRVVPRKGLAEWLGRPSRRRMSGDRDVADASPIAGEEHQDEPKPVVAVGTTKKSAATIRPM